MYCNIIYFKCDCIFYVGVLAWVMHACYLVLRIVMYLNNNNI